MDCEHLPHLTASTLAKLVACRELSPVEVAEAYLQRNPAREEAPRFDVVVIRLAEDSRSVRHIEDAFRVDDSA